jgi:hypothetical protein
LVGFLVPGYPAASPPARQVEGEPVVEVQEATDPLTPEEVREAQESDEADAEQP